MRRGLTLAVALLVTIGCRHAPERSDTAGPTPPPSTVLSPPSAAPSAAPPPVQSAGKAMKSYVNPYASPARASRVRTAFRPLTALARIAPLEHRPVAIVVSPTADHVGITYATGFDIWTSQGSATYRTTQSSDVVLTMLEEGFLKDGSSQNWDGRSIPIAFTQGGFQWAREIGDVWTSSVLLLAPMVVPLRVPLNNGEIARAWDEIGPRVRLGSERFFQPARTSTVDVWSEDLDGAGCGAIAEDRRLVVAMHTGRLLVFDGNNATPAGKGVRLVDLAIPFAAYDLSVVDSGYALLSVGGAMPADAPTPTPFASALATAARRVEFPTAPLPRWKTVVHHLDTQGHETAQSELPFEVLEPPVDGGQGRVYAFGNGVAAFDSGRLLYAHPSPIPMLATAFEDGSLALAIGPELRILTRDGIVRHTFTTSEHETITTPPAIASDGSIWVSTEKALYVAR